MSRVWLRRGTIKLCRTLDLQGQIWAPLLCPITLCDVIDYPAAEMNFSESWSDSQSFFPSESLYFSRAEMLPVSLALNMTTFLSKETDYIPWQSALDNLDYFYLLFDQTSIYENMQVKQNCPSEHFWWILGIISLWKPSTSSCPHGALEWTNRNTPNLQSCESTGCVKKLEETLESTGKN